MTGIREIAADAAMRRALSKDAGQHKYDHGHLLVLTGGAGRTGAARLAARAGLRIGAGLVTLGVPGAAQLEVAAQVTAIMLTRVDDGEALARMLEDARVNALCLGPALGTGARGAGLVAAALASGRRAVLDADALTLVAGDAGLSGALHDGCVLTPHAGEFARLFPDLAQGLSAKDTAARADAVRRAADRCGAVVLLKGAETLVSEPGCDAVQVNRATGAAAVPWLATAGAGDVLSGMIAGLLARGIAPVTAAATGAWLHAAAARAFGPGLIAEDLPEALPGVLRDLLDGAE